MASELKSWENMKTLISVVAPVVACLFFFFSLKAGVDTNADSIQENKTSIEKMEIRMEGMNSMLQENNTNIKLIQLQMRHMSEKMEQLVAALGNQ